jgi:hypothetical protein
MMLLKAALLISLPAVRTTACSNVEFDQCGGSNFTGDTCRAARLRPARVRRNQHKLRTDDSAASDTAPPSLRARARRCCPDYDVCTYVNSFFSQCQDKDLCLVAPYGQCGGSAHAETAPTAAPSPADPPPAAARRRRHPRPRCALRATVRRGARAVDQHQPPRPWTPANHHPTCCPPSFYCSPQNPYFSQCLYNTTANTTCAAGHAQCGGKGWTGKTCCACHPSPRARLRAQ